MGKKETHKTAIKITDKAKNNTFIGCKISGSVEIEKEAQGNKFIKTDITASSSASSKWYEKSFVKIVLLTAQSLLVAYLVYYFGWN